MKGTRVVAQGALEEVSGRVGVGLQAEAMVPAVAAAGRVQHGADVEALLAAHQAVLADDAVLVGRGPIAVAAHMRVAEGLVSAAELVLGHVVEAALGVKGATACLLAASYIRSRLVTIVTGKGATALGLLHDVLRQEAQYSVVIVAALLQVGAQILQRHVKWYEHGSYADQKLTRQLVCTHIFPCW